MLFQHVAQHVAELPLLIVGTYRNVDLDVARPFAEMLETLTRQRLAQKLPLGRLDEDGVSQMLEALSGQLPPASLATIIFAETEGNPFFTEEVFYHLSEEGRLFDEDGRWLTDLRVTELEVPEGIRLVVGRRIKRLSDDAQRVLTTAAVVGRSFDLRLLEELGDAKGDTLLTALEEAEAAKLVVPQSSGRDVRWEFAHGLIRQTLESSLSLIRRQRAHLRVAEAIERVHGANVDRYASDVAQHLYQAGVAADVEKTVRFLRLAGDESLKAGAFDEALRQFGDALSIREEESGEERELGDLRYRKGLALRSLGREEEAVGEWQPALEAFEQMHNAEGIAQITYLLADQTSWLDTRAARDVAQRGLDAVGDRDQVARARMLGLLARFSGLAGDPHQAAHAAMEEADALAATLDRPTLTAELMAARTRFHWSYMQFPEAIAVGQRAMAELKARGESYEVAEVALYVMGSAILTGQFRLADEVTQDLKRMATRAGHMFGQWFSEDIAVRQHLMQTGEFAESMDRTNLNIAWAEQNAPLWLGVDYSLRGGVHFFRGDWVDACADYDTALRLEPGGFLDGSHRTIALVARAYAAEDVLDRLREERSLAMSLATRTTPSVSGKWWSTWWRGWRCSTGRRTSPHFTRPWYEASRRAAASAFTFASGRWWPASPPLAGKSGTPRRGTSRPRFWRHRNYPM